MKIANATEAIVVLGGPHKVSKMFRPALAERVVYNWCARGLPPNTWYVLAPALKRQGHVFAPKLFQMRVGA